MKRYRIGWSLIEVVIAVAILVTVSIPLIRLLTGNIASTTKVGNYAKASALLAKFVEEVKHVPFSKYQEKYAELQDGKSKPVPEDFYQDTTASVNTLKEDKEFWFEASMKASKNDFQQLVEVAINVEIFWKERGNRNQESEPTRSLRDFVLIFNSETKF